MLYQPLAAVALWFVASFAVAEQAATSRLDILALGLQVDSSAASFDPKQGLAITQITAGGVAESIGLIANDLLQSFNGQRPRSAKQFADLVAACAANDPITVVVERGEQLLAFTGKMLPKPGDNAAAIRQVREDLDQAKKLQATREPTLAELLQQFKDLEQKFPAAIAKFKQQYPHGRFRIKFEVEIVSDETAEHPVDVLEPEVKKDEPSSLPDAK